MMGRLRLSLFLLPLMLLPLMLFSSLAAQAAVAPLAYSPLLQVGEKGVSADLRATPIKQAMQMVAARAGVDLYMGKGVRGTVTASFHDLSLNRALKRILRQRNFILTYDMQGKPQELWLINKGDSDYHLTSGYRGDVRHDTTRHDTTPNAKAAVSQTTVGRAAIHHRPYSLGAVQLHGAMGQSHWHHQMDAARQGVQQAAWRSQAINKDIKQQQSKLRQQLASAPPEKRPAIAHQLAKLSQQEHALQRGIKVQQIASAKAIHQLAAMGHGVKLPTQQIAQQKGLHARQLAMARMQRQMKLRHRFQNRHVFSFNGHGRSQQQQKTKHQWIVR